MADDRTLLVVDDEEVVCQACRRIFSRQGFQVEVNTDARQGLAWATEKDYSIILLDIKMPNIDGIEFLEKLPTRSPTVPVLIITGYPSIPNASAAMRLGACDYVTKPFTSEEITWAVQRVLSTNQMATGQGGTSPADGEASAGETSSAPLFWDESWVRMEADGSACVGAVLPGLRGASITAVRLPHRRSGLPGASVGRRNDVGKIDPHRSVARLRRRHGGERRDVVAPSRASGERSVRRRMDRLHLHDAARRGGKLQVPPHFTGQRRCLVGSRAGTKTCSLGVPGRTILGSRRFVTRTGRWR